MLILLKKLQFIQINYEVCNEEENRALLNILITSYEFLRQLLLIVVYLLSYFHSEFCGI